MIAAVRRYRPVRLLLAVAAALLGFLVFFFVFVYAPVIAVGLFVVVFAVGDRLARRRRSTRGRAA